MRVQNFGSQENSRVQREQSHSQQKKFYHAKQVCHIFRTVPTKYGSLCAKFAPCGKSRSLQKLLESTTEIRGSHAFIRDN